MVYSDVLRNVIVGIKKDCQQIAKGKKKNSISTFWKRRYKFPPFFTFLQFCQNFISHTFFFPLCFSFFSFVHCVPHSPFFVLFCFVFFFLHFAIKLKPVVRDEGMRDPKSSDNVLPHKPFGIHVLNVRQWFSFNSLGKVVSADQKPSLVFCCFGEGSYNIRAPLSKRLRVG